MGIDDPQPFANLCAMASRWLRSSIISNSDISALDRVLIRYILYPERLRAVTTSSRVDHECVTVFYGHTRPNLHHLDETHCPLTFLPSPSFNFGKQPGSLAMRFFSNSHLYE